MATVTQRDRRKKNCGWQPIHVLIVLAALVGLYIIATMIFLMSLGTNSQMNQSSLTTPAGDRHLRTEIIDRINRPQTVKFILDESPWANQRNENVKCAYKSLGDLIPSEANPTAGSRHIVSPPSGGKLSLVCCETTAGNLNIVAHHNWAPRGAERFLDMVTAGYFDTTVPFMRCVKGFLCQFGLNSDPSKSQEFRASIPDDPNWLPEGPKYRVNDLGVKRFAKGYLAYAGSGPQSRGNQLIMALADNGPLGGGSPWEVPWGEVVAHESFETLAKIYTGYGEKGPPQGQLSTKGMTPSLKEQFPKLDYIQSCVVVDEAVMDDVSKDSISKDD